jgi:hypothetical protein
VAELLDEIENPIVRAMAGGLVAYAGLAAARAPQASNGQILLGDTLRFTGTSIAAISAIEALSERLEEVRSSKSPFADQRRACS